MNSHSVRIALAAFALATLELVPGAAAVEQPRMDKAIELLQEAKKSPNPIPLLKQARESVEKARHNKGGRRPEAIKEIDEAIEAVKSGGSPEAKINHAIALIHSGEDRAN